jgi:hypothetical protein
MATAYTSLLGLALPVTGELSGSWGDVVNDSITSLLDSAISGTTSLTTDADVTLTTTTGAANQARQAIILWNPASGTTTRNITAPAQSKIYTVINASGGTQSIVFRGVGPTTGVTIVKGESAVVAWNGTDFIKVSNTSGAGVFTTLSASGAVTLSGGTANGVAYLNGSKVLTSGSALTFDGTNLGLAGNSASPIQVSIRNDNAGTSAGTRVLFGNYNGTETAYLSDQFDGSTFNVRLWKPTPGYMAFGLNNAEQMRLNSTGLGIGTSSPSTKLQVIGGTTLGVLGATGQYAVRYAPDTSGLSAFWTKNDSERFVIGTGANPYSGGTERLALDSSGNLGLGVTPSAWNNSSKALQVNNAALASFTSGGNIQTWLANNAFYDNATGWIYRNSSVGAALYAQSFNGSHNWNIAPSGTAGNAITFTQAMTLDASGRLGLGATSPDSRFVLNSASGECAQQFQLAGTARAYVGVASGSGQLISTSAANDFCIRSGSNLLFSTNGDTERARIDSSGVLRVNNTSTPSGNGGFGGEIAYIGNGSNGSLFYTTASSGSGTAVECTRQNDGAGIYFFRNGSAAGFINITTGAISVNNSSDYRLKENVETLSGSLSKVLQVRPVTFTWKENGAVGKSVIAHELQSVFPEVVFGEKDAVNEDGSIKPQSVALGNLVPDLIVAIQEQQALIQTLTARVAALESN